MNLLLEAIQKDDSLWGITMKNALKNKIHEIEQQIAESHADFFELWEKKKKITSRS